MSNKKIYINIALYNFSNSFLFFLVGILSTLKVFIDLKTSLQIAIVVFCAVISAVLYFACMTKRNLLLKIPYSVFINTLFFFVYTMIIFILYSSLKPCLPIAELNSGYGIWILMLDGIYLLVSIILKLFVLICFKKTTNQVGTNKGEPIRGRFCD